MTKLDIIIVNWNTGKLLRDCLESILIANRQGFAINRVVVVDNASSDGSAQGLGKLDLPLIVVNNGENRGFAAACNQGALGSKADYLLFLNPDTRLFSNSLSEPLLFMEQPENRHIGICGLKLTDELGNPTTSCARFPTLKIFLGRITGLSRLFPKKFPEHLMSSQELLHSLEVDQIIGAFFLVRRSVYEKVEGFDERFFMYFEEVDFSFRAKRKGYLSYYLSHVSAYHKGNGSTGQIKSTRLFYSLRSRIQYGFKHYSYWEGIILILITLIVEPVTRILLSIKRFSLADFNETMIGYGKVFSCLIRGGLSENIGQKKSIRKN
jgi:GT2 family glycosyltransferase